MGEKKWNAEKGNWEIDGAPVVYRVTWKSVDDAEEHAKEFTDVDRGYDFYMGKRGSADSYAATWEHIPW